MDASPVHGRPIRSFVAIEVEEPARGAILDYLTELRQRVEHVVWARPQNLHVTLKFLGGVAPEQLAPLAERLAAIAAARPRFAVAYAGVGAFPEVVRPQVLWVGAVAPELARLAAAVDEMSVLAGVEAERRPYHAHVTLGRVRGARAGRRRSSPDRQTHSGMFDVVAVDGTRGFGVAPATALVLFRSDTGGDGARHTALARLALGYE
ncbi:MAG: RNA 2',3'-cyclic phosphodiesterase [Deltaproteobacteria bacterium]|nr:RNA 2',3'-cyclic phosphodiesterase [Deltaproteobacteria bacterium]